LAFAANMHRGSSFRAVKRPTLKTARPVVLDLDEFKQATSRCDPWFPYSLRASARATSMRGWAATSSSCCYTTSKIPRARELVARKIAQRLQAPLVIEGERAAVTTGIGIARYPDDGEDAEDVVRNADTDVSRQAQWTNKLLLRQGNEGTKKR
jgi:hypothetical protein